MWREKRSKLAHWWRRYDIAGFEKDKAAYYRSWWLPNGSSFVRASPSDWTAQVAVGANVSVVVFTGAEQVEAVVNGVSLGRRVVSALGFADFGYVPFAPGNLTAVAYDRSGTVAAMDTVLTVGAAAALRLSLESEHGRPYAADGQDVALVRCEVVDSAGRLVPGSSNKVTFTVSGPAEVFGVGNGDPANLTPDKVGQKDLPHGGVWTIPAYSGLVRAIVSTVAGKPGDIVVHATASGLQAGEVSFTSRMPPPPLPPPPPMPPPSPPPPPPPPGTHCNETAWKLICQPMPSSVGKCMACCGEHQAELFKLNCIGSKCWPDFCAGKPIPGCR
jgi:hypothetical protein